MASIPRPPNPSPTKPVVSFPTASLSDGQVATFHDSRLPSYQPLDYGTPHPDQAKYPGYVLIDQNPEDPNDDRMVKRIWGKLPGVVLSGQVVTNDGQVGTLTIQRVAAGTPAATPSATVISASVKPENAVISTKETITVPEVFDEKVVSRSKPDVIPAEFRASALTLTEAEVTAGDATDVEDFVDAETIGTNVIEKSIQRVTAHKIKTSTVSRDNGALPVLYGQEYDDTLNIGIPFTKEITASGARLGELGASVDPLSSDFDLVKSTDMSAAADILSAVHITFDSQAQVELPDTLLGVTVVWSVGGGRGSGTSTATGGFASTSDAGGGWSAQTSESVTGDISFSVRHGFRGKVPSTIHIFFLPIESAQTVNILAVCGAQEWPVIREETDTLVVSGGRIAIRESENTQVSGWASTRRMSYSASTDYDSSTASNAVPLPRALRGPITVQETTFGASTAGLGVAYGVYPSQLSATSPAQFPTGTFLHAVDVSLYKKGFVKVVAETVNITARYT